MNHRQKRRTHLLLPTPNRRCDRITTEGESPPKQPQSTQQHSGALRQIRPGPLLYSDDRSTTDGLIPYRKLRQVAR